MLKYGNHLLKMSNKFLALKTEEPVLPPYTMKLKFTNGVTPTFSKGTGVQVSSSPNIWILTYQNTDWGTLLSGQGDLIEVIDANTTGVTYMASMFNNCSYLTSVPLFDTSSVTNMNSMFNGCSSLTIIPLFNTSKVTSMYRTFRNCYNVESGALALYQQASTQTTPPTNHNNTFTNCGRDTTTGAAERAQIPTDWGGTMSDDNPGEIG